MFAESSDCGDLVSSILDIIFQLYYATINNIDNLILAGICSIKMNGNKTPRALENTLNRVTVNCIDKIRTVGHVT